MRPLPAATACLVLLSVGLSPAPASAGLFDLLFGGGQRTPARVPVPAAALPAPAAAPAATTRSQPSGGSRSFCVRLCDGFHFPIEATGPRATAEVLCAASCPGTEVAVFRGPATAVENAVDARGRRYADLPAAFSYRTALSPGCGCRRGGGYAALIRQILDDPTLRRGDIVVTPDGASVFAPVTQARVAWTGADFVDIRRPGALSSQAFRQAERVLGPSFDVARPGAPETIRVAERRDNEIVVTPGGIGMRGTGPRVIMDAPFAR